MSKES